MRYTQGYAQLQSQLHADRPDYGTSGHKHADRIADLAKRIGTKNVLDYGAGKCTLAKSLPFPITSYDPFIEGLNADPVPHDLVVCGDVLEHIEPECVDEVLAHLASLTKNILFIDVAIRPAKKTLADGRNAHLIQEPPSWWLLKLATLLEPCFLQTYEGGFIAVFTPKGSAA